ncbi:SH3 domain-containing protein Dlish [Diorhabda carinulata]|uniref:SH3 domain-containing protein Dlish n=1 Tax=Diorhabda sublineata TaxID=1163346 RepID=UPI0024E1230F|nr:SH3 domain-containing protein Dlish [Diorhabda sublineata]XP_057672237.1 SH3 domain-containing protein Dlish [Diorhabda carinulata]
MAFLCPVRIRRGKKKKSSNADLEKELARSNNGVTPGMGRITGSASIETLVRVGIEKEHGLSPDSKMVVLHDFTPCVDDELEVKRGQIVNILYRENDWVYVIGLDTRQEGFIPYSYCTPYNNHLAELAIKKKLPRDEHVASGDSLDTNQDCDVAGADTSDCDSVGKKLRTGAASPISIHSEPDMIPFSKDPSGRYIVLYTFIARDENDVSVERGEFVTVLNREDPDWYWIVRSDGQEGFIPSGFVYPADNVIQGHLSSTNQTGNGAFPNQNNNHSLATSTADDLRYHGTELVMLYDYKAQAPDDLTVRRGDWIYADLNNQTVDGWLWAYAPKTRKYGFIPKAYARPPAMTSL